jgi:hypothetical protein
MLTTVVTHERYGVFAVNDAGDVCGLCVRQYANSAWHGSVEDRVPGRMAGNAALVEAGGQFTRGFRCGLDYAFILIPRMRSVLSGSLNSSWILVPARHA